MDSTVALFAVCSLFAIAGALGVVLERRAFYSGLGLGLTVLSVAGLFALLGAHFLAALQVLIYVGAVIVLFLFVVWFLGVYEESERPIRKRYAVLWALTVLAALGFVMVQIWQGFREVAPASVDPAFSHVRTFALRLFERYAFPLELTSLFFLIALVAAIYLSRRRPLV